MLWYSNGTDNKALNHSHADHTRTCLNTHHSLSLPTWHANRLTVTDLGVSGEGRRIPARVDGQLSEVTAVVRTGARHVISNVWTWRRRPSTATTSHHLVDCTWHLHSTRHTQCTPGVHTYRCTPTQHVDIPGVHTPDVHIHTYTHTYIHTYIHTFIVLWQP